MVSISSEPTSRPRRWQPRRPGRSVSTWPIDVDRRHLGAVGDVAGDEHDRPELADAAREARAPQPVRMAGTRLGRTMRRSTVGVDAPSDAAASSISWSSSSQHRLHGAHHEGQRDEQQREHDARLRVGDVDTEGALRPVQRQQRQAGHDGGQGEGQVDEGVDDGLAGEVVAHQDPGDERAHHDVDDHHHERDVRVSCSAASACGEVTAATKSSTPSDDRAPQDGGDGDEHEQAEVGRR